jgi:hypothetical protein
VTIRCARGVPLIIVGRSGGSSDGAEDEVKELEADGSRSPAPSRQADQTAYASILFPDAESKRQALQKDESLMHFGRVLKVSVASFLTVDPWDHVVRFLRLMPMGHTLSPLSSPCS